MGDFSDKPFKGRLLNTDATKINAVINTALSNSLYLSCHADAMEKGYLM